MIVCRACGHRNDDNAQFCVSCQAYLEWDGDRIAAGAPADAAATPSASAGSTGPMAGSAAAGRAPEGPPTTARRAGPTASPGNAGTPAPATAAAPQPGAAQPAGFAPVQPAAARPRPPAAPGPVPPSRVPLPDALYCSVCGTDNDPDRRLCRSCGAPLLQARPVAVPWWRRLLRRYTPAAAGERPGRDRRRRGRRTRRALRTGIALALVAIAAAVLAGPGRDETRRLGDRIKGLFTTRYEQVTAVSATASSQAPRHPATAAVDGASNTAWAERARGDGLNQTLTIVLNRRSDLARIAVLPGASDNQKQFLAQPRPRSLLIVFPDGSEQKIDLRDEARFQEFKVDAREVDRVTLRILDVYKGQSGSDTSIAEVQFFTER